MVTALSVLNGKLERWLASKVFQCEEVPMVVVRTFVHYQELANNDAEPPQDDLEFGALVKCAVESGLIEGVEPEEQLCEQERHLVAAHVSAQSLARLLKNPNVVHAADPLPRDARIVRTYYDKVRDSFVAVFEHESFDRCFPTGEPKNIGLVIVPDLPMTCTWLEHIGFEVKVGEFHYGKLVFCKTDSGWQWFWDGKLLRDRRENETQADVLALMFALGLELPK